MAGVCRVGGDSTTDCAGHGEGLDLKPSGGSLKGSEPGLIPAAGMTWNVRVPGEAGASVT